MAQETTQHTAADVELDRTPPERPRDGERDHPDALSTGDLAALSTAQETPAEEPAASVRPGPGNSDREVALVEPEDADRLQRRWSDVQAEFVDDPRGAVRDADALVAELMQSLAQGFAQRKESLEDQWSRQESVDTEQLRVALQSYRSFFARLIAT